MRLKTILLLFALALVFATCQAAAAGDGTYAVREYPLPANATEIGAMTVDANGNVWLLQDSPPVLYKLVRENGTIINYTLDGFKNARFTGMTADDTGVVWFTDQAGDAFGAYDELKNQTYPFPFHVYGTMEPSSILRKGDSIFIGCNAEFGEYDLRFPDEPLLDHFVYHWDSYLMDIHSDRLGNVWAVEYAKNNVTVYWHVYDKTSEWPIPTENAYPTCLSIDSLGRLWFVESGVNKLGMFQTEMFNFSEYTASPIDGKTPRLTNVTTVGEAVWLTDAANDRVLRFYPDENRFVPAQLANGSAPTFIYADANGTLWVYESGSKKLASIVVTDGFGQATPTPAPTATPQPTAAPTAQPTKTPGFMALMCVAGLALAMYICRARK